MHSRVWMGRAWAVQTELVSVWEDSSELWTFVKKAVPSKLSQREGRRCVPPWCPFRHLKIHYSSVESRLCLGWKHTSNVI